MRSTVRRLCACLTVSAWLGAGAMPALAAPASLADPANSTNPADSADSAVEVHAMAASRVSAHAAGVTDSRRTGAAVDDELLNPHATVSPVPADPVPQPTRIAPGVYALLGTAGEVGPANHGAVANTGFIVGPRGVVIVDSGASYRYGKGLLAAIRKITPLPVKLLIITHQAPEFVFGAAALRDSGVPILAHRETAALIRERCATCLKNLHKSLGDEQMRDSRVAVPERTVAGATTIAPGGREIDLLHYGTAATPGDLAVFDTASGVLFAGGLVSAGRIPELRTESIPGWLDTLHRLERLPIKTVIPGFGPPGTRDELAVTAGYLRALEAGVGKAYANGSSLEDAMQAVTLPAYGQWRLHGTAQAQNVQRVYLQFESGKLH